MGLTLVTGSTGTIGFNIVKLLIERGRSVRVLVRDVTKAKAILPAECDFFQGDITSTAKVEEAMNGCEVVYHCAGLPEQWFSDHTIFDRVNLGGTVNILASAKRLSIKKLVYTSTIDVFQAGKSQEYDESIIDPKPKGTHYERSKQKADQAVVESMRDGLDVVFLHPSAVYGPGPRIAESVGVNDLILKSHNKDLPMLVPGGFPVVYSEDVALGHILAENATCGSRYILSDKYMTLTDIVAQIYSQLSLEKSVPISMPVWFAKVFAFVGETLSSITKKNPLLSRGELTFLQWQAKPISKKAKEELGWNPTSFEDGLKVTISKMKENGIIGDS